VKPSMYWTINSAAAPYETTFCHEYSAPRRY